MDINYKMMGIRISQSRKSKNMTQSQLAEITGLSNNYISNIECNHSKPSLETLVKICNTLEVSIDYVLMDSLYVSKEYIKDDIALKLKHCTNESTILVSDLISVVIEHQKKQQ